jgi:hypothetical protein
VRLRIAAVLALVLAGCFQPTWRKVTPQSQLASDTVVLVGSFSSDPPIVQHGLPREGCRGTWVNGRYEPPGKIVFVQETDGNVMAFFTKDLAERWDSLAMRPVRVYDWTYMPIDGHFFVEVPRSKVLYLRGFTYLTNAGPSIFELPARVDVGPQDRVVYVGDIRLHRNGRRGVEFRNGLEGARRAARERGLDGLLTVPWKTRLLKTVGNGPSLGDEYRDGCQGRKKIS